MGVSIQEEVYQKLKNFLKSIYSNTMNSAISLATLGLNVLKNSTDKQKRNFFDKIKGRVDVDNFFKALEVLGEKPKSFNVPKEDIDKFIKYADKCNFLYCILEYNDDDGYLINIRESQVKEAEKAISMYYSEKGRIDEVRPDIFYKMTEDDELVELDNLSDIEFELFRWKAREAKFAYTIDFDNNDNKKHIILKAEDMVKAQVVLDAIGWDLTGDFKDEIIEQTNIKINNKQILDDFKRNIKDGYVIVDSNVESRKSYIKFESDKALIYKDNKLVDTKSFKDKNFRSFIIHNIENMHDPVILNEDEFTDDISNLKKKVKYYNNVFPKTKDPVKENVYHDNKIVFLTDKEDEKIINDLLKANNLSFNSCESFKYEKSIQFNLDRNTKNFSSLLNVLNNNNINIKALNFNEVDALNSEKEKYEDEIRNNKSKNKKIKESKINEQVNAKNYDYVSSAFKKMNYKPKETDHQKEAKEYSSKFKNISINEDTTTLEYKIKAAEKEVKTTTKKTVRTEEYEK